MIVTRRKKKQYRELDRRKNIIKYMYKSQIIVKAKLNKAYFLKNKANKYKF